MLMDTHSIVTMNSLESNVTSELAGGTDSNQAGMPAGRAGTSYAEAARLAEEATKARTEEDNNSNTDDVNQTEDSVQVNQDDDPQVNQQGNQQGTNKDEKQGNQQPDQQSNQQGNQQHNQQGHQQDNQQNQQGNNGVNQPNPVTPKSGKHIVGASGGRGRGGGRGNYSNQRNVNFGRGGGLLPVFFCTMFYQEFLSLVLILQVKALITLVLLGGGFLQVFFNAIQ